MTLLPDQRMLLSDALTPPEGFEFEAAMAVTYSLDLRALLAAPLALSRGGAADAGVAAVDAAMASPGAAVQTPLGLTASLRRCADKLTVFAQAGHVAAPVASHPVLSFLEDCVIGVSAPRGGVVHAKAWVLRYRSSGNPAAAADSRCLRVLISSRNLTWDRSWDTVIRFDASPRWHAGAGRRSCRCLVGWGCLPARSGTCTVRQSSCGRTDRAGVRARGVSMLAVGLGARVGPVSSTAGSRRSAGGPGAGGPVAAGPIVGTNRKLPDNVLASVWSAAYGLYRHRCPPRAFLDRSRRDEWHEQ